MTAIHAVEVNGTPVPFTAAQFWERVVRTESCWEWVGARAPSGYGQFSVRVDDYPRTLQAHRMSWELLVGETIPDGREINHLCRNRGCVNPAHLEVVSRTKNAQYGSRAKWPVLPPDSWGALVQAAIVRFDLEVDELGELVGVSGTTISAWANGRSEGHPRNRRKLRELLRDAEDRPVFREAVA